MRVEFRDGIQEDLIRKEVAIGKAKQLEAKVIALQGH